MKIYNYKTGKAVFVNNEKIEISNKVAEILENYTMFPENMYQDLGIEKRPFVQDKDEDVLKMAESTEVENFESNGENNFNVTFMLYKGVVFGVYGEYEGQDANCLRQFNLTQVYNEFKNLKK
nr:hypothetical protein [Odoribacter splanchnicus]